MRISSTRPRPYIDGYLIRGSDGSRDTRGKIKWSRLSPRFREDNSRDRFEHILDTYDPSPKLRFSRNKHHLARTRAVEAGTTPGRTLPSTSFFPPATQRK